ncbi:MAG: hypothetical protein P8X74_09165 [Reinekea sp.]
MLPKNWGAPAIFEQQIEIKLLHSAFTEGVTDSGYCHNQETWLSTVADFVEPYLGSVAVYLGFVMRLW